MHPRCSSFCFQPTRSSKYGGSGARSHLVRLVLRAVLIVLLIIGIVLGLIGCFMKVNKLTTVYAITVPLTNQNVSSFTTSLETVNTRDAYFSSVFSNSSALFNTCSVTVSAGSNSRVLAVLNQSQCDLVTSPTIKYGKPGAGLLITGLALAFIGICLSLTVLILVTQPGCSSTTTVMRIVCFVVVVLCTVTQLIGVVLMCVGTKITTVSSIPFESIFSNVTAVPRTKNSLRMNAGPPLTIVSVILFAAAAAISGILMC